MSGRRVILEKLSAGPPSLEVTRHLVAQHTKINNNLKDTTPRQALIEAVGILDQLPGQNALIKKHKNSFKYFLYKHSVWVFLLALILLFV